MLFWGNIYGVGNADSSPVRAVLIDIFMMTTDCTVGLIAGLPIFSRIFDYRKKKWWYIAGSVGRICDFIQLAAILAPSWFFVLIAEP